MDVHLAIVFAAAAGLQGSRPAAPTVVDAGPLQLEIYISRTAHLFHVVDQVSAWSPYCHSQYRPAVADASNALAEGDDATLEEHRRVRAERPWGAGLEQAFYTPLGLDEAIHEAVARGNLTDAQAAAERATLLHFAERVDRLLEQERPRLEAFAARLLSERDALRAFAAKVSRFCGGARVTVPVYLIANPAARDFGGGYNGERLTLEVPRAYDVMPALLHEAMHAFAATKRGALQAAAAKEPSLDFETLNEGIAYALNPGIYHSESEADPLGESVARDAQNGAYPKDSLARFRRYGLALRPLLRDALDDDAQTIETFLPRAVDAWRVMREISNARIPQEKGWFSAGPAYRTIDAVARERGARLVYSTNHMKDHYRQILERAAPGSRLVLTFALDHADRNPVPDFADLMPKPLADIEAALRRGEIVELRGHARELDVVVLGAPTVARLETLIRETKLLVPEGNNK